MEKKENSSTRKTLGIKKKLSIKPGSTIKPQDSKATGSNTVVVVTKSSKKGMVGPRTSASHDNLGNLTAKEREARLKALKVAEEEHKTTQAQHESPAEPEMIEKEQSTSAESQKQEAQAQEFIEQGKEEESLLPKIHKKPAEPADEARSQYLRELASGKKRVKNLDAVKRTAEQVEDVSAPTTPDINKKKPIKAEQSEERELKVTKKTLQENRRNHKRLSVTQVMMMDQEGGEIARRNKYSAKKKRKDKTQLHQQAEKIYREVTIPEVITVSELASRMTEKSTDVIKELMKLGVMATVNQSIDADIAEIVVNELGHTPKRVTDADIERELLGDDIKERASSEDSSPRAPVVTIMGHVDHGKTSLLDVLRSTDVVSRESGGITQHIGAYKVSLPDNKSIAFLDTPGHEAFTAMRMRGAEVTDVVILVVAADDGIKEQTVEAINHAKAAEVPIVVAINKVDKPDADIQRVKNELLNYELIPEEMGGDVMMIEVSAKQRIGIDKLTEAILLQSEMLELKAHTSCRANGAVIEAKIESGRGVSSTLMIQNGTLKLGDMIVAGTCYGRIKALNNERNEKLKAAGPSTPVEILGLSQAPTAGDEFIVVDEDKKAREIVDFRIRKEKEKKALTGKPQSMEQLFTKEGAHKTLKVIVKADVQGSVEAIVNSLSKLSNDEVNVHTIHSGVGAITESDVTLAQASKALIFGFNIRANAQAREAAQRAAIKINYYSIIYQLVDEVKSVLSGLLSPEIRETFLGYAEVRQVFNLTKVGKVAGCYVTSGKVRKGVNARLIRDNTVIHEGALKTLKRFKDDVKEVNIGFECGISFERYDDIKEGDTIESFEVIKEQRQL